jgi:bidirectional [NiFe] hydrogenase diaphorase subunit
MVELTIDGIKTRVTEGSTVLEAAREIGIAIPTLCYYPGLSCYGECRVCLVEVVKGNRSSLEASCTLPVEQGQVILSGSAKVTRTRKLIVELLLSSCPNSKTLQDMAASMGINKVRFKIKDRGCILCGRCVRYCKEQMNPVGSGSLAAAHHGGWGPLLMSLPKSAATVAVASGYVRCANKPVQRGT